MHSSYNISALLKWVERLSPESHGHDLISTDLYGPESLDRGAAKQREESFFTFTKSLAVPQLFHPPWKAVSNYKYDVYEVALCF